jgi:hypothetical protein
MIDAKWDQWRTSTVVGICARIRETGDYSALPILADALQDAGCEDQEVLAQLRSEPRPTMAQRLVCQIHGGEPAAAVRAIDGLVSKFTREYSDENYPDPYSYQDIMEGCGKFAATGDGSSLPSMDYEFAYDKVLAEQFWANYEIITGTAVDGSRRVVFSCSC